MADMRVNKPMVEEKQAAGLDEQIILPFETVEAVWHVVEPASQIAEEETLLGTTSKSVEGAARSVKAA